MEEITIRPGQGPKYLQFKREIEARVADGRFPEGGRLPPERDLMAWGGVSRQTVRAAFRIPLCLNEPSGTWRLTFTDSGTRVSETVVLRVRRGR